MSLVVADGHLYVKVGRKFLATEATVQDFDRMQSELRRLRISQLRRMADLIDEKTREWGRILDGVPKEYRMEGSWRRRWMRRMRVLRTACLAEIERLRGMG